MSAENTPSCPELGGSGQDPSSNNEKNEIIVPLTTQNEEEKSSFQPDQSFVDSLRDVCQYGDLDLFNSYKSQQIIQHINCRASVYPQFDLLALSFPVQDGAHMLNLACLNGHDTLVPILISYGANLESRDYWVEYVLISM